MGMSGLLVMIVRLISAGNFEDIDTPPEVEKLRELFEQDRMEFAQLLDDSLLHCDPALCDGDYRDNQKLFRHLAGRGGQGYHPIADSLLPDCQAKLIGDSVTIVWREGIGRGATTSAGYYRDECGSWSVCEISPSDTSFPLPDLFDYEPVLVIRRSIEPPQSVRAYKQMKLLGESIRAFQDSVTTMFAGIPPSRQCWNETDIVLFDYFMASDSNDPDTVFATAHGAQCSFGRWEAVYLLTREDSLWSWRPLIDLRKGSRDFTIGCSFDLNSDGHIEYLVWDSNNASLYTLIGGKLHWIASAREHPC